MNRATIKIIEAIALDIFMLLEIILDQNNLGNSKLKKESNVKIAQYENPIIHIFHNDYLTFIETGRKPQTGRMPPLSDLREWAISKGLPTDNKTLFAITKAIWKNGIEPIPILHILEEKLDQHFNQNWSQMLFDSIVEELTHFFNE